MIGSDASAQPAATNGFIVLSFACRKQHIHDGHK
jgi:hypothetical protein